MGFLPYPFISDGVGHEYLPGPRSHGILHKPPRPIIPNAYTPFAGGLGIFEINVRQRKKADPVMWA